MDSRLPLYSSLAWPLNWNRRLLHRSSSMALSYLCFLSQDWKYSDNNLWPPGDISFCCFVWALYFTKARKLLCKLEEKDFFKINIYQKVTKNTIFLPFYKNVVRMDIPFPISGFRSSRQELGVWLWGLLRASRQELGVTVRMIKR